MRPPELSLFALVALSIVKTSAQPPPYRSANSHFYATVHHAVRLNGPRQLRLYDEPHEIVIEFGIGHDSPVAASGNQQAFAQKLRVAVRGPNDGLIGVLAAGFFERGKNGIRLAPDEPLTFPAGSEIAWLGRGLNWSIQLRKADGGRFTAGRYVVDLSLAGAAETLQMADGSFSRAASSDVFFAIQLGPPTTDEERVRMYVSLANEAMQARLYDDVVTNALYALNLKPSDVGASLVLGGALMRSNRC